MEDEVGRTSPRDGVVDEVSERLGHEDDEGTDEASAAFLPAAHPRGDDDPGTRRVELHERSHAQAHGHGHEVEEDPREEHLLPIDRHAPQEHPDDRKENSEHHVHVEARIHDPVAQRARRQRRRAHADTEAREGIDAAQASRTRRRGPLASRFLLGGLVDEITSLVDGPLRVGTDLTRVAAHDGT